MGEFFVQKNKVTYKLSNGKELIDTYEKEKEKELKSRLDKMEETINFKYNPYDFSFVNLSMIYKNEDISKEIVSFLRKLKRLTPNEQLKKQIVLGINQDSKYKDKWFIYNDDGKNNQVINELKTKPYCARVDYLPSKGKAYLQYMENKNGDVVKEEFDIKDENITDDDILNEYLK